MKKCPMCKNELDNEALFCPYCGVNLLVTPAEEISIPPVAPTVAQAVTQPQSPSNPFVAPAAVPFNPQVVAVAPQDNKKAAAVRSFFASKSFLAICILMTCTIVFSLIPSFMSPTIVLALPLFDCLIVASMWLCYGNAKKKSPTYSTSGITFLSAMLTVMYVLLWIAFAFIILVAIMVIAFSGTLFASFQQIINAGGVGVITGIGAGISIGILIAIMIVAVIVALIFIVLMQQLLRSGWKELSNAKQAILNPLVPARHNANSSKVSVLLIIFSVFSILGVLFSCITLFSAGSVEGGSSLISLLGGNGVVTIVFFLLSGLATIASYIMLAIDIKKYKKVEMLRPV